MTQRIAITGATGLIGGKLALRQVEAGESLVIFSRDPQAAQRKLKLPAEYRAWDTDKTTVTELALALEGVDAIVHLAGEPVADGLWSENRKQRILDSRVRGTRAIAEAARHRFETRGDSTLKTWLSASAIGYYGDAGDRLLEESSKPGSDFLAQICERWEAESLGGPAPAPHLRRVAFRIGIVLSHEGGALSKLTPIFRSGLGGPIGRGRRWMSWIHVDDLVAAMEHALRAPSLEGPVNAVAPGPVTNAEFTRALAHALHRPAILPVPPVALRAVFGQMSEAMLGSQRVSAEKLLASGFKFTHPEVAEALESLFGRSCAA